MKHVVTLLLLMAACTPTLGANDSTARPDSAATPLETLRHTNSWQVGTGWFTLRDTYLSLQEYDVSPITFLYTTEHARNNRRWSTLMEHEVVLGTADDKMTDNSMLMADYHFYWGRLRAWSLMDDQLRLQAGVLGSGRLGVIYATRNSNNPAQMLCSIGVLPTGRALFDFKRMTFGTELSLLLAGLTFSPNFGQSYYEIFSRDNYDRNLRFTTPASQFTVRWRLWADWHLWRDTQLTLACQLMHEATRVNHLERDLTPITFSIGFTRSFDIMRVDRKNKKMR